MNRLTQSLYNPRRQLRLAILDSWYRGEPPLPEGAKGWAVTYRGFQRQACSNFAELIPESVRARMAVIGIRTSDDEDATGDAEAWRIWRRAHMPIVADEVHNLFLRFGESYALVQQPDPGSSVPIVTAEDPRMVIGEQDVLRPWALLAGLKVYRDAVAGMDYAYLYRPGRVDVAFREAARRKAVPKFDGQSWELSPDVADGGLSGDLPDGLMPLVLFQNRDCVGEFERHVSLLERINRTILERMTIATLQAFKQRGIKGLPNKNSKTGAEIDYTGVFEANPGSLWLMPETAEVWESGAVDLTPILASIQADVKHLAAVTQTPMHTLDPGGENQSAEGAAMAREGLVFKVRDRIQRVTPSWSAVLQTCFQWIADVTDDPAEKASAEERANLDGIDVIWASPELQSLNERSSAAAQAHAAGVTWRTTMIDVMGYSPQQVDRMESERQDDLVFAQQLALIQAKAAAAAPGAPKQADLQPAN
jgi:hypothetical protein